MKWLLLLIIPFNLIRGQHIVDLCNDSPIQTYSTNGYLGSTFIWTLNDSTLQDTTDLITISFRDDTLSTYTLEVNEVSEYGCEGEPQKIRITIKPCFTLYIPNTITLTGDGINEFFEMRGEGWEFTYFQISIHDRWGELLFFSTDPYFKWDGTYLNKQVPQGVYSYRITFEQNKQPFYKNIMGSLNVLR